MFSSARLDLRAMLISAAIILSALGGVLMFGARTGPEEASSNLSKWMAWMGIRRPPTWLTDPPAVHWSKRVGVLSVIAAAIVFSAWVYGKAQTNAPPSVNGNCNNFGNSNFNCNVLNIAPGRLKFSPQVGEWLLRATPDKSKRVVMQVVGGNSSQATGDDFYRFLTDKGYQVDRGPRNIGMLMDAEGAPDGLVYVWNEPNSYRLVVKPGAQ
jgi:hypothetical protein